MQKLIFVAATMAALSMCAANAVASDSQCAPKRRALSPSCRVSTLPYKLGVARYTMHKQPFDHVLEMLEDMDCHYLGLMEGSIKYDASDAEIEAISGATITSNAVVLAVNAGMYFADYIIANS